MGGSGTGGETGTPSARLVLPSTEWQEGFLAGMTELHDEDPALWPGRLEARDVPAYVEARLSRPADAPEAEYWLVEDGRWLGTAELRREPRRSRRRWVGDAGYAVRPSQRGRGCGHALLGLLLAEAARRGRRRLLLTCEPSNAASRAVILAAGGERAGTAEDPYGGTRERYWVPCGRKKGRDC